MKLKIKYIIGTAIFLLSGSVYSQFKVDGQYIIRGEIRDGYQEAHSKGDDVASFVAHRARVEASYKWEDLTMYMSVQDVRTWGDNITNKASDGDLSVYEAWAEYKFNDKAALKVGRQELVYDNARFLGNLDWALQGRAHDFALFKYEDGNRKLHIGAGFGEDSQKVKDTPYLVPNYKNAQMLHYSSKLGAFDYSFLFWNEGRQNVEEDKVRYRQVIGLPTLRYAFNDGKTVLSGFYYHQFGKNPSGQKLSAYDANLQITHQINLSGEGKKLKFGLGAELLSGTNQDKTDKSNSYLTLYGTNHIFNGFMDTFPKGNEGLQDYYIKGRMDFNSKFFTQLDAHFLNTNAKFYDFDGKKMKKYLGTELDLSMGYLLSNSFSLQAGYSHLFASKTFRNLRGNDVRDGQNWAYLMLIFRPTKPAKFIGVPL